MVIFRLLTVLYYLFIVDLYIVKWASGIWYMRLELTHYPGADSKKFRPSVKGGPSIGW